MGKMVRHAFPQGTVIKVFYTGGDTLADSLNFIQHIMSILIIIASFTTPMAHLVM